MFKFGKQQEEVFSKLKDILSQKLALSLFQQEFTLELHTDASSLDFGATLMQK